MNDTHKNSAGRLPGVLRRVLCVFGVHDFRMLEVRFGIGKGNNIEKLECRRCGVNSTRRR